MKQTNNRLTHKKASLFFFVSFLLIATSLTSLLQGWGKDTQDPNELPPSTITQKVLLPDLFNKTPKEKNAGSNLGALIDPIFCCTHKNSVTHNKVPAATYQRTSSEYANAFAIAGIYKDGSIFAIGDPLRGGTSPLLPEGKKAVSIFSSYSAFAAILDDGSIVTWGSSYERGKMVQLPQGRKAVSIASTKTAFAAILDNGSVIAWGKQGKGGNTPQIPSDQTIIKIVSTESAFAAISKEGNIFCWGNQSAGGKAPKLATGKTMTCCLATTRYAIAGKLNDGSLIAWGNNYYGGKTPYLKPDQAICCLYANDGAFTATLSDHSVICWGASSYGGRKPSLQPGEELDPCSIVATPTSFAGILSNGLAILWGGNCYASRMYGCIMDLPYGKNVSSLVASNHGYLGLLNDGSLAKWGLTFSSNTLDLSPILLSGCFTQEIIPEKRSTTFRTITGTKNAFVITDNKGHLCTTAEVESIDNFSPECYHHCSMLTLPENSDLCCSPVSTDTMIALLLKNGTLMTSDHGNFYKTISSPKGKEICCLASPFDHQRFLTSDTFQAIAITSNCCGPEQGIWECATTPAGPWSPIPQNTNETSAFVLNRDCFVRFVPKNNFVGEAPCLEAKVLSNSAEVENSTLIDTTDPQYSACCSKKPICITQHITM